MVHLGGRRTAGHHHAKMAGKMKPDWGSWPVPRSRRGISKNGVRRSTFDNGQNPDGRWMAQDPQVAEPGSERNSIRAKISQDHPPPLPDIPLGPHFPSPQAMDSSASRAAEFNTGGAKARKRSRRVRCHGGRGIWRPRYTKKGESIRKSLAPLCFDRRPRPLASRHNPRGPHGFLCRFLAVLARFLDAFRRCAWDARRTVYFDFTKKPNYSEEAIEGI